MDFFKKYLGKQIVFEISGDGKHNGFLVDIGPDILVVFEEAKFLYIPLHHVYHLTLHPKPEPNRSVPQLSTESNNEEISYLSTLSNAKGLFCEIHIADRKTMHGYMTDILTDYFIFTFPLDKIIMVPLFHLKWMSPYERNATPYSLNHEQIVPLKSTTFIPSQTFREQLKQQEGSIISLNEGLESNKIGLLQQFEKDVLELVTADEKQHYYHIQHIKNICIR
jgi:hypothetical protein